MQTNERIPVLIVGGGPVGLTTALLLAQQHIPALLVEKHTHTAIGPRARGLNVRSMEIFRSLGVETALRQVGAPVGDDRYMLVVETLAGKEIRRSGGAEVLDRTSRLSPGGFCLCPQNELEPCLVESIHNSSSRLYFDHELVAFQQDSDGIRAEIVERTCGTRKIIHAQYMVAADGPYSSTREHLQIATTGRELGHYINIYFRAQLQPLARDRPFVMCFVRNPAFTGTLVAVDNRDRWTLNTSIDPQRGESVNDYPVNRCIEMVQQAVGLADLDVEILNIATWIAGAQVADRFSAGRVFLVGDAAHRMPPAGAYGMNTGIQDAHNLAWKLAAVIRKQAAPDLLQTYETERRPLAQLTVERASQGLEAARIRQHEPMQNNVPPHKSEAQPEDGMSIILGYRYASSAIIDSSQAIEQYGPVSSTLRLDAEPGTRAPHVWLEQRGKRISTLDLYGTQCVLLSGSQGESWVAAANSLARQQNYPLVAYSIGEKGQGDLHDPDQDWASTYKIAPDEAILIRPDGFVAWRSDREQDRSIDKTALLAQVLRRILGLSGV